MSAIIIMTADLINWIGKMWVRMWRSGPGPDLMRYWVKPPTYIHTYSLPSSLPLLPLARIGYNQPAHIKYTN